MIVFCDAGTNSEISTSRLALSIRIINAGQISHQHHFHYHSRKRQSSGFNIYTYTIFSFQQFLPLQFINMSDPNKYTVGWICAIRVEAVAASILLDEEHDRPMFVHNHNSNVY
jgi:hypothetical protein